MKCNYFRDFNQLSPSSRKRILNSIAEINEKLLRQEMERMKLTITNNLFKMFVVAANQKCGIGKNRIQKILDGINDAVINMEDDNESFFMRLEEACKQILGEDIYKIYFKDIPFKMLPDNFDLINDIEQINQKNY